MPAFIYALPEYATLQQEAVIARGLRSLFPDVEFDRREGGFLTGDIIPVAGHVGDDSQVVEPPRLLVQEVRTAFAGLLVDALAGQRVCEACG